MGKIIDVSLFQGTIDWSLVKSDNVDAAVIKATQANFVDPQFRRNQIEARRTMRRVGYYHFFTSTLDPVQQAKLFVSTVGPLKSGEFMVFDGEERGVNPTEYISKMSAFMNTVKALTGELVWIYCSPSLGNMYNYGLYFPDHPLWVAHYGVLKPVLPKGFGSYVLWQYGTGMVKGISDPVDMNVAASSFWFDSTGLVLLAAGFGAVWLYTRRRRAA